MECFNAPHRVVIAHHEARFTATFVKLALRASSTFKIGLAASESGARGFPYRGNTSHGTKLPVTPHHLVALPESPQPPGVHGSAMAPVTPSPGPSGRAFIVPCAISFVGARGPDSRLIFNGTLTTRP